MRIHIIGCNLAGLLALSTNPNDLDDIKKGRGGGIVGTACGDGSDKPSCQNGGVCNPSTGGWTISRCSCPEGFEGEFCQLDSSDLPCDRTGDNTPKCLNGSTCINQWFLTYNQAEYDCICQEGYIGDHCETYAPVNSGKNYKFCKKIEKKSSFCQLFKLCHFSENKRVDEKCIGTCHDILDSENWPNFDWESRLLQGKYGVNSLDKWDLCQKKNGDSPYTVKIKNSRKGTQQKSKICGKVKVDDGEVFYKEKRCVDIRGYPF